MKIKFEVFNFFCMKAKAETFEFEFLIANIFECIFQSYIPGCIREVYTFVLKI